MCLQEVANNLRDALQSNNLKDRMSIKMDSDLRYGEVRFDHSLLHAKILDLPTIMECLKTIDNKSFYKSADICQLVICKETPHEEPEKESPNKAKKRDPNKVDRKYLYPHGLTPPFKNCRKRRFRKTLKKKNVEAPEIEKEVKRLLRVDNDAVRVDFEIIDDDADKSTCEQQSKDYNDLSYNEETQTGHKTSSSQKDLNIESDDEDDTSRAEAAPTRLAAHDIFGGEVSSSDDDNDNENDLQRLPEADDTSRISAGDSRMSHSLSMGNMTNEQQEQDVSTLATEFNQSMFVNFTEQSQESNQDLPAQLGEHYDDEYYAAEQNVPTSQRTTEQINFKIMELRRLHNDLKTQHAQKTQEIANIQNPTLKQRLQETADNLHNLMMARETEIKDYEELLLEMA